MQKGSKHPAFDVVGLLAQHNTRWALSKYKENQIVYAQGDPADSVFYVHKGKVKLSVVSKLGKEAIVAIRGPDEFCGEGALTGRTPRLATMTAVSRARSYGLRRKSWSACSTRMKGLPTISLPTF
jgi:CRP/FNR family transcriptional regulator, cyclic AMP receptor protein